MVSRIIRACLCLAVLAAFGPAPVQAQNREITEEFVELLIKAFGAEESEKDKVAPQLSEIDAKVRKFNECKTLYEAGAAASGSRLGGIAARAAIRAKCGASDTEGFEKEREKVMEGPEKAALAVLGLKLADYRKLKDRLKGYFATGSGFTSAELAVLNKRRDDLIGTMRYAMAASGGGGAVASGGGRGGRSGRVVRTSWTSDYAWEYIGHMFNMMYLSGAMIFEQPYEPGQWTRWEVISRDERTNDDNRPAAELETKGTIERAFLARTEDGNEWWRTTSIDNYDDGGTMKADTVILESLFKPVNEYVKSLVRVRAKLPGQEANELMVPQHFAMLSLLSIFPMKPTEESVKGATIGTERIGEFDAQHVRFAAGGGTNEWWLSPKAPGGWVQFRSSEAKDQDVKEPGQYTMKLVGSGTGAKSVLGVM